MATVSVSEGTSRHRPPDRRFDAPSTSDSRWRPAIWLPALLLLGTTAAILLADLDLRFQRLFFSEEYGWWLGDLPPVAFLYHFGTWPGLLLGLGALGFCLACIPRWKTRRHLRPALFLVLVIIIGPGLMVDESLKRHYGRPRPLEVKEFGGFHAFRSVVQPDPYHKGKSFPSGHASMGFYLLTPYFFLGARRRRLARVVLTCGVAAGLLVGLSRIMDGSHFLSDVIWSGGIVYFAALGLYYVVRPDRRAAAPRSGQPMARPDEPVIPSTRRSA